MKAKVSSISAIICLITLLFFCILACDNGSASSSASNTDGLVKVSLSVAGDSVGSQKSISVDSSLNPANFKYFYKAVPKWTQNRPIHGSTNDQFILIPNYSAGANIGYFTAGEWQFFVQIRNGSTVVYEGSTNVTVVSDNFAVNVLVNKIIQAASGSVSVTVTAPTVASEAMTVAWSGTASGSGAATATPLGDGTTRFTFTKNDFSSGYYTFTLNHSSTGSGAAIAVDLSPGERADITGHLENGTWQVGYITVKIYSINVIATGCTVQSNVTAAAAGEKVSFYITPYAGSVFDDLTVEWAGGDITPVPVAGLYTFEMPAGDVDLTATYSGVSQDITIAHFKAIFKILYDSHPGQVTSFEPSASAPAGGTNYFEVKNVKLWYNNHKILWYTDNHKVTFKAGSMANFFKDCSTLQTINLTGFQTAAVNNMSGMFQNCTALTSVTFDNEKITDSEDPNYGRFNNFNTSAVESMAQMFDNCINLVSLNLAGLDTRSVESMFKMFFGCYRMTTLKLDDADAKDISGKFLHFNTANVTDMSYMFSSTDFSGSNVNTLKMKFTSLDVSGFDTSSVTNLSYMFYLCSDSNLTTLDVSGFDTSNVTDMNHMFACYMNAPSYLTTLDLRNWDFSNVTTVASLFDRCEYLNYGLQFPGETQAEKDLGIVTNFKSLTTMYYMFSQCARLDPDKLGSIVGTWQFSEQPNYMTTVYGNTTTSLFGRYGEDSSDPSKAVNYLIRDRMLKGGQYANFKDAQDYTTADGQHLYIGGKKTTANCYLTVRTGGDR